MTVQYYVFVRVRDRKVRLVSRGEASTVPAAARAVLDLLPTVQPAGVCAYANIHPNQPERYHEVVRAYRLTGNTKVGPWVGRP